MGGRYNNKKRKGGGGDDRILKRDFKKGKRENVWDPKKSRVPDAKGEYKPYCKENEKFEEYYKGQRIVPEDMLPCRSRIRWEAARADGGSSSPRRTPSRMSRPPGCTAQPAIRSI